MGLRNKLEEGVEWDPFEVMFFIGMEERVKVVVGVNDLH